MKDFDRRREAEVTMTESENVTDYTITGRSFNHQVNKLYLHIVLLVHGS